MLFMFWIALLPSHDEERIAWGWRALQYTPRVAPVDEAILVEASASLRLWGGRKALLKNLLANCEPLSPAQWAQGRSSLEALGLLRMKVRGQPAPQNSPHDLPLDVLTAAIEHAPVLERVGCRTWGDLLALPRQGLARRFGTSLLSSLDAAFAHQNETYPWLVLPESFDMNVELMALATTAPELMWSAQRLLTQLQVWLQARNRGVLALELEWKLDLRRLNGVKLPPHEQLVIRTAQPTQDITHLRRLVSEHLGRAALSAPASYLRLRSLETQPWGGAAKSLLPEDNVKGERLHQLIERLSVRLGESNVVVPCAHADHRVEEMQQWKPARGAQAAPFDDAACDPVYPTWLLPKPLRLEVKNHVPQFGGPLRRLTRLYRIETGWWEGGDAALRDYFIARSEEAGLVWIFRERPQQLAGATAHQQDYRWYLQGLYA
jgi:protein ImuB